MRQEPSGGSCVQPLTDGYQATLRVWHKAQLPQSSALCGARPCLPCSWGSFVPVTSSACSEAAPLPQCGTVPLLRALQLPGWHVGLWEQHQHLENMALSCGKSLLGKSRGTLCRSWGSLSLSCSEGAAWYKDTFRECRKVN